MRGWAIGLLAVVLLVVAGAAAIIGLAVGGSSATPIVDLEVGDCFDLPDETEMERFETVDLIDCDQPHQVEVVLTGELNPDGDLPYPDDDELFASSGQRCNTVTLPVEGFGLVPLAPTADTWEGASGRFACLALQIGGEPSEGSLTAGEIDGDS